MNNTIIPILIVFFVLYRFLAPVLKGQLSYRAFKELLEGDAPPLILDVRTPAEYRSGHIPGSKNVPYEKLPGGLGKKLAAKDRVIVLYCQSGSRSSADLRALKGAGYRHVQNFGAIGRWRDSLVS